MIIEKLIVPLLMDNSDFISKSKASQKEAGNLGNGLASIGGGIVGAALGATVAGIGAIAYETNKSIDKTAEWGNKLDSIGDILGTSASESAGLALMIERVGGTTDQLTTGMKILSKGLVDTKGELGATGATLTNLGIDIVNSNGKVRSATEIFQDVADVVGNMPDGLEKTALMMEIFGKSGADLGDVLGAAANGGLSKFNDEAERLGLSMTDEQVQNTIEYGKANEKLNQTMDGLRLTFATSLIPTMTIFNDTISDLLANDEFKVWLEEGGKELGNLATSAITNIPVVLGHIGDVVNFFRDNEGIVVGVLAAMSVAVISFGVSSLTASAGVWALIAPMIPALALMALIGLAAYLLYEAWDKNFLGIKDITSKVFADVKRLFDDLEVVFKVWKENNILLFQAFWAIVHGDWAVAGLKLGKMMNNNFDLLDDITSGRLKSLHDIFSFGMDDLFLILIGAKDWSEAGTIIVDLIKKGLSFGLDDLFRYVWDKLKELGSIISKFSTGFKIGLDMESTTPQSNVPGGTPSGYYSPVPQTNSPFNQSGQSNNQNNQQSFDYDKLGRIVRDSVLAAVQ